MRKIFSFLLALVSCCLVCGAQLPFDDTIRWKSELNDTGDGIWELVLKGAISEGWHTYPLGDVPPATTLELTLPAGAELVGDAVEEGEFAEEDGEKVIERRYVIKRKIAFDGDASVSGSVSWMCCRGTVCHTPESWEFTVSAAPPQEEPQEKSAAGSIWKLIIEAVLWGFAMLLTPCVFPMVPMTVSYFLKGSDNKSEGRFKALMYGLFIVLLYTLPICIIIGVTLLVGGNSVTADIFNWLSTHWLPNLLFFAVFMVFAASFFGAFEITLPSKWTNAADKNSDRKGLTGVFFIALTLVLVSFSCTGPIVGTVLIKSTEGEFWTPMVTMLAFSVAFALPFTVLALFPSLLKNLPKSGSWLNSVKIVLGFIEIALGFKFLSTADQTYHWGILDREVYLAIWISCFTLLGLYLIGKIRFKNDSPLEYLSFKRLALAMAVFSFVIYMLPGMWGAPLKALSGYLPPMETQDFVLGGAQGAAPAPGQQAPDRKAPVPGTEAGPSLVVAQGLSAYDNIGDALEAGRKAGKPVFVDISGHGCVNCREMEARVWSDPRVKGMLQDDYVLVTLYTDDKTKLPEDKWMTTDTGKVLKDVGRVNSYIVRKRFNVNAQPNYALLDSGTGELIVPVRGYDLDVEGYIAFLKSGLER